MIYEASIGTRTRAGKFMVDIRRIIESDMTYLGLQSHLGQQYVGYEVMVTPIEKIEAINSPTSAESVKKGSETKREITHFSDLRYSLKLEPFRELYDAYRLAESEARWAENKLKERVRAFVESKPFIHYAPIDSMEIQLGYDRIICKRVSLDFNVLEEIVLSENEE